MAMPGSLKIFILGGIKHGNLWKFLTEKTPSSLGSDEEFKVVLSVVSFIKEDVLIMMVFLAFPEFLIYLTNIFLILSFNYCCILDSSYWRSSVSGS